MASARRIPLTKAFALAIAVAACSAAPASALKSPAVTGTAKVGQTLTATHPVWAWSKPVSTAWWRCQDDDDAMWNPWPAIPTSMPNHCSVIAGTESPISAPKMSYQLTKRDRGRYIRFGENALQTISPWIGQYYVALSRPVGPITS